MVAIVSTSDRLQALRVWLEESLDAADLEPVHVALYQEADLLDQVAARAVDSRLAHHIHALVLRMRRHLDWVDAHQAVALRFELFRELDSAHMCAQKAWHELFDARAEDRHVQVPRSVAEN